VIHVFAVTQKEKYISEITQNKALTEIRVYHKKVKLNIPLLSQTVNYLRKMKAYKKAYAILRKNAPKPDAAHLNVFYYGGIFALYLKRKFNIPFIVTEHWTKFLPSSPKHFNFFESMIIRATAKQASYICPVSHDLKKALQNFGISGPFRVIPNVTDTEHFKYKERKSKSAAVEILHASHMGNKHKNIIGILNALKMVSEQRQDIIIRFLGSDDTSEYEQYANKIGLPENMYEFLGKVSYEEVAETMNAHDAFLMFSNYENLPCVISEAHVSGLPVISSDVGGISEMIDKSNGILVQARNEPQLVEAILNMSDKLEAYNRKSISEIAEKRYSYQSVGQQYSELYKKII
jgi:glycosyltransferase involved in cell wall biosynthesis